MSSGSGRSVTMHSISYASSASNPAASPTALTHMSLTSSGKINWSASNTATGSYSMNSAIVISRPAATVR